VHAGIYAHFWAVGGSTMLRIIRTTPQLMAFHAGMIADQRAKLQSAVYGALMNGDCNPPRFHIALGTSCCASVDSQVASTATMEI
jgi:hypothetical protein